MNVASKIERLIDAGAIVVWKPVKDYAGLYEVSNEGDVRSLPRNTTRGRILKPGKVNKGYLSVRLCKEGQPKMHYVHRLVMQAFVGECPADMETNHLDEDKTNNCVANLQYTTRKQNINHGTRNARVAAANKGQIRESMRGNNNPNKRPEVRKKHSDRMKELLKNNPGLLPTPPKAVEAIDPKTGLRVYYFDSARSAARFGFQPQHISDCCLGKVKTHRGYFWRFAKK